MNNLSTGREFILPHLAGFALVLVMLWAFVECAVEKHHRPSEESQDRPVWLTTQDGIRPERWDGHRLREKRKNPPS